MPIIIDELPKDGFVKVLTPVPSTVIGDGSVHVPTTDALVEPGEIIILVNDRRGIVALRPGANPPIKVRSPSPRPRHGQ
jgi:hypothetical protein